MLRQRASRGDPVRDPRARFGARQLVVSREDPRWAAVSAFGAAWLVGAAGNALATLPRVTGFPDPAAWLTGAFGIAGAAMGVAVAFRAGGRRGVLWYVIALVANALVLLVTELPFYVQTCSQLAGPQDCSPLKLVLPHAFTLAGLLVSVVALRLVARGGMGSNPLLSAGGAVALVPTVLFTFWRLTSGSTSDPIAGLALGLGLSAGAMLAAGAVLRSRATSRRSLIAFAVIVFVLRLGTEWTSMSDIVRGAYDVLGPAALYGVLAGPVELSALFLGWMLLLPGADDRGGLMQVGGEVQPDEEDPASRG
ncbi:MAG: hypothetical protein M3Z65_04655 [Chloroflexota bacterium]|nr:hypothetical protein [Chloroflexota bacterium]